MVCVNCNKTVDKLFIELLNICNKEAENLSIVAASLTGVYDYKNSQAKLVQQFHKQCLIDDELIIKDIE